MIGTLSARLRETLFIMHQAVFFIGNAYFGMGNQEEAETAAYAEAEQIRKQVRALSLPNIGSLPSYVDQSDRSCTPMSAKLAER